MHLHARSHAHAHTHTVESSSGGVCVCFCVGVEVGGWCGVERLHQYSAVAPCEECVGGGKEGGMVVVVVVGGAALPQSRTVRWAGTKRHDGGLLDWPGPARAPRPAKTQSTAPVQTRELAALFACLTAITPGLEQYATSSPQRSHSHTMRIHTKAMKTSLVHSVCPGGGIW